MPAVAGKGVCQDRHAVRRPTENDRKAIILIANGTLTKPGATLVDAPCDNEFSLASVRLGSAVIATVTSPKGTRGQGSIRRGAGGSLRPTHSVGLDG